MRNKSLVFKSVVAMTVLLAVMSGVFTTFSYMMERSIYNGELSSLHTTLTKQIELEWEGIAGAAEKLKSLDALQYVKDQSIAWIHNSLNGMIRDNFISNTYLLFPEMIEQDGKSYLKLLQGSQSFIDTGIKPGDNYELPPELIQAVQDMKETGTGLSDMYEDEDGEWITVFKPIQNKQNQTVAIFAVDFNNETINDDLNVMLWKTVGVGAATGAVFIAIIVLLIRRLILPLKQLSELSKRAANGDLTVTIPVTSKDEIGVLSDNFNVMMTHIKQLVANVKSTADHVAESSDQLSIIAEQTAQSSHEISGSIQEVASGSETQLQGAEESKAAMSEIAIGIQRIAESTATVSELSLEAAGAAQQGNEVVQQTMKQMNHINNSVHRSVEITKSLTEQSKQIEQVVGIIGNVATQTNLLALNASIEAARAGEHGRGFGVVAQEVRQLAEQTKASTEQIAEMLHSVVKYTRQLAEAMENSAIEVQEGAKIVQVAGDNFQLLWTSVQDVTEQVQEVSAAAQEMSAGSEEVAASLENLAEIARSSSESSQSVAASSEEQLAIVEEISDSAVVLNRKMKELQEELRKFTL
ncbi:methyl-accepting chemotaxis protein [Paenibacillus profundus]|uniref:Methyl-accepting chemotaxis protein n=1 Tax=Paenibacillus profundus TaxID=1173085 RepID=A0ABS8YM69_9BACL|nr:methyl-accepting chemotaxis protein [Paenibacillus profundus]MCE5172925.1 methyl-accepting chemotaxis protein [Paenibacillus profundus]